jgi:hypothetical protein
MSHHHQHDQRQFSVPSIVFTHEGFALCPPYRAEFLRIVRKALDTYGGVVAVLIECPADCMACARGLSREATMADYAAELEDDAWVVEAG